MIISSWNVNSVRARINNIKEYLKKSDPDIVMMQEIKTEEKNYPFDDFKNLKYESYVFGQKSYNGVAFITKNKLNNIKQNIFKDKLKQSRVISGELTHKKKKINLINIYTPNGNPVDTEKYEYKKEWLIKFISNVKKKIQKNSNILIDKTSADLLKGSEVDFVKELIGEQFRISNPQSKSSCGCGVSFSL